MLWSRAAVLIYTMPVWATIFAAVIYEKINISIIISLILGTIGIVFLSREITTFKNFGFIITLSAGLVGVGTFFKKIKSMVY